MFFFLSVVSIYYSRLTKESITHKNLHLNKITIILILSTAYLKQKIALPKETLKTLHRAKLMWLLQKELKTKKPNYK